MPSEDSLYLLQHNGVGASVHSGSAFRQCLFALTPFEAKAGLIAAFARTCPAAARNSFASNLLLRQHRRMRFRFALFDFGTAVVLDVSREPDRATAVERAER